MNEKINYLEWACKFKLATKQYANFSETELREIYDAYDQPDFPWSHTLINLWKQGFIKRELESELAYKLLFAEEVAYKERLRNQLKLQTPQTPPVLEFHSCNLEIALGLAIEQQRIVEQKMGFTRDSGLVAGWVSLLDALIKKQNVKINN